MLKMQILGNIGKDAIMHQHGTDNVLQFSVAHTDKYKDSAGMEIKKTTWVECSWWIDGRSTVGQYLKKGQMVYVDGFPGSKTWTNKEGKAISNLTLRVFSLQLCGGSGQRDNNQQQPSQQDSTPASASDQGGYMPVGDDNDLPF